MKDKGCNKTHGECEKIITTYSNNNVTEDYELHSHELLSPNGIAHLQDTTEQEEIN